MRGLAQVHKIQLRSLSDVPLRDNTIRDNFNSAFAACKLSWSGTHIARHTFATLALISERDLGAVQAALGHASQKVTAGYAKVVALQTSRTSGRVAEVIGLTQTAASKGPSGP